VTSLTFSAPQIISKISIEGNKKISDAAIKAKIIHRKGERIRRKVVKEEIHRIFKLGYFDDISVFEETAAGGIELVYKVKEKPVVSSIIFDGNFEIDKEDLEKEIELKPYNVLNTMS
jgi:outer membrane protein insertion porin family